MKSSKKRDISYWIERDLPRDAAVGTLETSFDSRTGVTTNRVKEVWKGQLNEFYEGWRRTQLPSSTSV
jgi:hypothetical protein